MNRLGPLVEQLTAATEADGRTTLFARPPGPAGLATVTVAGGQAHLAVDVADPDNLVSLTYVDPAEPATARLLRILLDRPVLDALRRATGRRDRTRIWRADPESEHWRRGTGRGGLGRIGHLALLTGELERTRRSPFGTAIGLLELAALAEILHDDVAPVPGTTELLAAATRQLREQPPDTWGADLDPATALLLIDHVERWDPLAERSDEASRDLDRLVEMLRLRVAGPAGQWSAAAAAAAPMPMAARPMVSDAMASEAAPVTRALRSRIADAIEVVVDPSADDLEVEQATLRDGHLYVDGEGAVHPDAWVRAFEAGSPPVLVAMAPVRQTGPDGWSARALLPAGASAPRLLVDLTRRANVPWRSPALRAVEVAIDLGAAAATATRRDDPEAGLAWYRAADAWQAAGDDARADQARRLAFDRSDPTEPDRPGLPTGPHALDLVD